MICFSLFDSFPDGHLKTYTRCVFYLHSAPPTTTQVAKDSAAEKRQNSRERDGEVEPLPESSEGDERLSGEAASGHLAKRLLVLPRWTLAHKTAGKSVHTPAAVLTHTRYTSAR